ncbi:MAG TPA: hypothetical protein VGV61_08590 [Thermoanaerobaculia bacterium]|jgi:hypothetical protein|nr:hypothetical protein [Thermoanaerobaculia bacterium]
MRRNGAQQRMGLWAWVLALVLLALLVWAAGRWMQRGPRPELGVTGGDGTPAQQQQPPAEQRAERPSPELPQPAPPPPAGSEQTGEGGTPRLPAAPAPPR